MSRLKPTQFVSSLTRAKPRKRESRVKRGYDSRWYSLRAAKLSKDWKCVRCGNFANEVDHIRAIEQGGARFDWANLMSLCKRCHTHKTNTYDGGFGHALKDFNLKEFLDSYHNDDSIIPDTSGDGRTI